LWKSASGGIGRTYEEAEKAAIGEALERYGALACTLPMKTENELHGKDVIHLDEFSLFSEEQKVHKDFPYNSFYEDEKIYTNVFSLFDNKEYWVPIELVTLDETYTKGLFTSSGLAAGASPYQALLRALQEIIERDALMITWQHSIRGKQIKLDLKYTNEVETKGGTIVAIDATPAYSPFPVCLIAGTLPIRGHKRISLGCACRETWADAVERAYLEWVQGIIFTGYYYSSHADTKFKTYGDVQTFDDHAVYYTICPDKWNNVPLTKGKLHKTRRHSTVSHSSIETMRLAVDHLTQRGIRLYYRDLTTKDLKQIGVYSARVLSPDLTPIHADQRWPFLGGKTYKALFRDPWAKDYILKYPNPMPHPLG